MKPADIEFFVAKYMAYEEVIKYQATVIERFKEYIQTNFKAKVSKWDEPHNLFRFMENDSQSVVNVQHFDIPETHFAALLSTKTKQTLDDVLNMPSHINVDGFIEMLKFYDEGAYKTLCGSFGKYEKKEEEFING